ncbi:MAG TPA: ABC transporter ATP-binding protein [Tenuifilaceae bacterium]|jgi:ABC-type multidrug transport system ATPase subunit|nr:ABC transporter ATP-binding protein [Bacteroidales bacterium]MDI9517251.1 ABC transporter ATP-binding protein [Bacteroidota bacterium]NLH57063.1 ABC transporter ATP-binding protein [Rikenellaceae bacterium]OQC61089.1 MAG: putative ABC transporter ATP-binding protein YxlF [Bacteroidetes bacterium ADurb.Bin008]HNV81697.1 ABC transporter ATP-binding protein [Tenuifilaceae bacterium]
MELKISNLTKTYPNGVVALKNVSLTISNGMFGLLGANGAGKSTLMRIIATLQEPDSGTITLNGIDVLKDKDKVRQILGYLPQEFGLYPKISAEMLLNHLAQLKGIANVRERKELIHALLQRTNLWEHRHKSLGGYSGGMKQRFGIAQALIGQPKLIIVDEPTAGLDPSERNRFHNLLSEISENIVVILSSHIVDDVESLCNQMAIIDTGVVLVDDKPGAAINAIKNRIWRKVVGKAEIGEYNGMSIISQKLRAGKLELHLYSETEPGLGFELVEPALEDVYFSSVLMQSKN